MEEALPIAMGVGAALLPAMAFGGIAAARAFIYVSAAESGVLDALEAGKSEEEALKGVEAATVIERSPAAAAAAGKSQPVVASPVEKITRKSFYGFAARYMQ